MLANFLCRRTYKNARERKAVMENEVTFLRCHSMAAARTERSNVFGPVRTCSQNMCHTTTPLTSHWKSCRTNIHAPKNWEQLHTRDGSEPLGKVTSQKSNAFSISHTFHFIEYVNEFWSGQLDITDDWTCLFKRAFMSQLQL